MGLGQRMASKTCPWLAYGAVSEGLVLLSVHVGCPTTQQPPSVKMASWAFPDAMPPLWQSILFADLKPVKTTRCYHKLLRVHEPKMPAPAELQPCPGGLSTSWVLSKLPKFCTNLLSVSLAPAAAACTTPWVALGHFSFLPPCQQF